MIKRASTGLTHFRLSYSNDPSSYTSYEISVYRAADSSALSSAVWIVKLYTCYNNESPTFDNGDQNRVSEKDPVCLRSVCRLRKLRSPSHGVSLSLETRRLHLSRVRGDSASTFSTLIPSYRPSSAKSAFPVLLSLSWQKYRIE